MSGTAKKDGMQLIGVIMGAPDFKTRFLEVIKMFEFGFSNYGMIQGEPKGKEIGNVQVYKGEKDYVGAIVKDNANILVNKTAKQITSTKIDLCDIAKAPIHQNAKLGELIYYSNDQEIGRVDLVAKENVAKANFKKMFEKILNSCFK
jgi:D-alanyl-D-alanine carboxypeptidase (penicillin-binding protein 5/6)